VTIGLPSWLTDKDNELAILVAYFVALIVVIPTVVGLWCDARECLAQVNGDWRAHAARVGSAFP
jgi:preprotein translocase subunit Sec63